LVEIDAEDTKQGLNPNFSATASALLEVLDETKNSLNQPAKIAVIGRPNAGKSTLLNSLLVQNLLPVDHAECTAVSIEVLIKFFILFFIFISYLSYFYIFIFFI
jgi:predicted GTPase